MGINQYRLAGCFETCLGADERRVERDVLYPGVLDVDFADVGDGFLPVKFCTVFLEGEFVLDSQRIPSEVGPEFDRKAAVLGYRYH